MIRGIGLHCGDAVRMNRNIVVPWHEQSIEELDLGRVSSLRAAYLHRAMMCAVALVGKRPAQVAQGK
jgi:hypothetical protein